MLVTGGAGDVGSHVVLALREAGYPVVVLDDLSTGRRGAAPPGAAFVEGDVGDPETAAAVIAGHGIAAVLHLAASIDIAESLADPLKYDRNNAFASASLVRACVAGGVERFLFASSAAVYGMADAAPVGEDAPAAPVHAYRIGASCPVEAWRRGWAGYAEMGAVAWHAIGELRAQIDADTWCAMERALGAGGLEARSAHPALAATSALVRRMLEQTGRSHVARAPDDRTLCALEIPRRLWRALGEAGPRPEGLAVPQLSERWWVVEVEAPGEDEPNAIALWEADGAEVALAGFLCPGERGGAPFVTVVPWRTSAEGERSSAGLAALRAPVHADDPDNPESRAGLEQIIEALTAPHTGPVARAKTAIALHRANNAQAPALGSYRPSAGSARARADDAGARPPRSITALFAIERAPEPETAELHAEGRGHGRGGGGRLEERQRVRAHFKRQAFGSRLSRRRLIVIEGYRRGAKARRRPDRGHQARRRGAPSGKEHTRETAAQAPAPLTANAVAPMDGPRARVCRARRAPRRRRRLDHADADPPRSDPTDRKQRSSSARRAGRERGRAPRTVRGPAIRVQSPEANGPSEGRER